MISKRGREMHAKAEYAREIEQDFIKSLSLLEETLILYEIEGDLRGFTEALQSRSSVYKHLFHQTENSAFLVLAKHDSLAGIEIAEDLDEKSALVMVYRGLGKILEQLEDWSEASKYFQKAIKAFDKHPPKENDRPAVRSDMKAHLAYGLYMSGKKSEGAEKMHEAISELEEDPKEQRYNRDVWLSGAYMRSANMYAKDDPKLSRKHFDKAERIIDSNQELKLRKAQLLKLESKLKV